MAVTFICDLCGDHMFGGEAFYGYRDEQPVVSCFDCYLSELKSFTIHGETIRNNVTARDIDPNDQLVFYDRDGRVLSKLPMHKLSGDQLPLAKQGVSEETGMPVEYIALVIEPHDHAVRQAQ